MEKFHVILFLLILNDAFENVKIAQLLLILSEWAVEKSDMKNFRF